MPGKETEGVSTNQPAVDKASKQDADKNKYSDADVDPKYGPEVDKAYNKNVGSNKAGNDARGNHDSNTRQEGS